MKQEPSGETDCHVPVTKLKEWSALLKQIRDDLAKAREIEALRPHAMLHAQFMVDFVRDRIEPFIDEVISIQRLKEEEVILNEQKVVMDEQWPDWEKQQLKRWSESKMKGQHEREK